MRASPGTIRRSPVCSGSVGQSQRVSVTIDILENLLFLIDFQNLRDFSLKLCLASGSGCIYESAFSVMKRRTKSNSRNKWANDMLGGCIRAVAAEMNVGISELVQKTAFIQYLSLIMTSWTVVTVGHKWLEGIIAAVEMLTFK